MDEDVLTTLKILIIGESGVGKSSLPSSDILGITLLPLQKKSAFFTLFKFNIVYVKQAMCNQKRTVVLFPRLLEASAKTCDGVQCAFEELVEKIIQTPGLWESENQNKGVKLSHREESHGGGACGGYCSVL
ncbi:ras-related protein Rab-18 [Arvicanthis niloticus]|uniref:ras-related protein Rab-18 n=1 Tax=Arvicanthis niloticus TaxID=61156 RepID=UPI0014866D81|nr:ras-related protein Rab-18 [Arvicanthis niloticus]